ncbi:MAG: hypothetical protein CMA45_03765 [Euryarchaeota archaeon]|nr:hypothetical protein [Euryarchaeota archaeon]
MLGIGVSNNFWEDELEKKSEEDFEKELDEIEKDSREIRDEPENTVELNEASFGGIATLWFFTIVWCSASFFATVIIGSDMIADIGTRNWESADGIVENSYVSTSTDGEGGTTYCLHVDYQYTVDGRVYDGNRISYSADNSCNSWSANSDDDYPEGKKITVYYDPSNPSESVLLSGLSGIDFFICCFFIFPLVGLLLLFGSINASIGYFKQR